MRQTLPTRVESTPDISHDDLAEVPLQAMSLRCVLSRDSHYNLWFFNNFLVFSIKQHQISTTN